MKFLDMAVVGSGIGGSLISSLTSIHTSKEIILFEKDKNLGGCASTFKKFGNSYNTGATTLAGYEDGCVLKKQFDTIGLIPNITKTDIAIRVIQDNTIIDRIKDFEVFLDNINLVYPNKNNRLFWEKLIEIDKKFWNLQHVFYGKFSLKKYLKTANFITELLREYGFDIFKSADGFISSTLGNISIQYKSFIDAQLLITIQSTSKNMSILSLALGLCYPFHDLFYVNGGMGTLIEDIVKDIEVRKNEEITKIIKDNKHWVMESDKGEYRTKQLVLNSSIYQCSTLFENINIKKYYDSFSFSDQSAFVLYLTLEVQENFLGHYQFIYDAVLRNSISNSFFVSFSKQEDKILSKNGLSVTISTHTRALFWNQLKTEDYELEKSKLQECILNRFLEYFTTIRKENIKRNFCATSITFNKYISRYNCGGKAIGIKNVNELPSCNTPFEGLYNVGDTVFAGQGWPGVSLGVEVLNKELNASS